MKNISYIAYAGFKNTPVEITAGIIMAAVAETHKMKVSDLKVKTRKLKYKQSRFEAMYLIRRHTLLSTTEIGVLFNRDHSTVIHACRNVSNEMDVYPDFKLKMIKYDKLFERLSKGNVGVSIKQFSRMPNWEKKKQLAL